MDDKTPVNDPVNHPAHYTDGKIEVIDFIEDKQLNFCRGNAVKYIARAGKKDPAKTVEDLEKAMWYINREIVHITGDMSNFKKKTLTDFLCAAENYLGYFDTKEFLSELDAIYNEFIQSHKY